MHGGRARTACQLGNDCASLPMSGDGRDIFQRGHRSFLDSSIRQIVKSTELCEKLLLTTENHHIFMVAELVRPTNSAQRGLYELATCQETVVTYFSAGTGLSLAAVFGKL